MPEEPTRAPEPETEDVEQSTPEPEPDDADVEVEVEETTGEEEAAEEAAASDPDYLGMAQRAQADLDNFRKRSARDVSLAQERGMTKVVRELLPSLDNLELAIAAAEAEEADSEHHLTKGIRLVQSELMASLKRLGIETYSPKGEVFDPNQHEALSQQPFEGAESGTVVEVFQAGYRLGETVLRPARVVVAA